MAPSSLPETMKIGEGVEADRFTQDHMASLRDLVNNLNESAQNILKTSRIYDRVAALVTYWSDDFADENLEYMKTHATELWKVFGDEYGFEVGDEPFELPGKPIDKPRTNLQNAIKDVLVNQKISSKEGNNLFILYYGGHGDEKARWQPKLKGDVAISWDTLQDDLTEADCDILFIFDCCHGGKMVNSFNKWRRRCELLCATAAEETTLGANKESFTRAVTKILTNERKTHHGCDIITLHNLLNNQALKQLLEFELDKSAWYQMYSKPSKPAIALYRIEAKTNGADPVTPARLKSLSNARVLLKVAFSNPDDYPLLDEWEYFVRNRPNNVLEMKFFAIAVTTTKAGRAEKGMRPVMKLTAAQQEMANLVFNEIEMLSACQSNSITAIMSIPLWLWDMMEPHPAIEFIAIVQSHNLLKPMQTANPPSVEGPPPPPSQPPIMTGATVGGYVRASQESRLAPNIKPRYTPQINKIRLALEENARSRPRLEGWDVGDKSLCFLTRVEKSGPSFGEMFDKLPSISINAE